MTVFVNAIMYYKVKVKRISEISDIATLFSFDPQNATAAVANVDDYSGSAQLLAATTLRNINYPCFELLGH